MAAPGAPRPSHRLAFLLLLLAGPAAGNEGGASGSCSCRRATSRPRFPDRVQSCDTCKHLARFKFPNRSVCGLPEDAWVIELRDSPRCRGNPEAEARKANAGGGHRLPDPTSPTTGPPPTSPSFTGASLGRSPEGPQAAEPQKEVAWVPAMPGSPPEPSAETAVRRANEAAWEEKRAKTPGGIAVAALFCAVAGAAAGLTVLAFCWRRRKCSRRAQTPPRGKGEESACLPA